VQSCITRSANGKPVAPIAPPFSFIVPDTRPFSKIRLESVTVLVIMKVPETENIRVMLLTLPHIIVPDYKLEF
jgi:hypothetical protein